MTSSGSCANKQRGSVTHDQPALRDVTLVRAKTGNVIKHGPCCINISRCDPSPASHTFQNGERVGFFFSIYYFSYRVVVYLQSWDGLTRHNWSKQDEMPAGGGQGGGGVHSHCNLPLRSRVSSNRGHSMAQIHFAESCFEHS